MNAPKDNTLKIVLGVVGCFGCAGVVGLLLLFGVGFAFGGSVPATPPVVAPVPPVYPGPSTSPLAVPTPAAPADWSVYTHAGPCAGSESLRLAHFQVAYPPAHRVLDCHSQTPRPWNYVTFHEKGESEANQIGLGHSRGAVNQEILASVAAQLARQLGAATPDLVDASPLAARGAALTRRDMAFAVPETRAAFRAGPYVMRQVVVPGLGVGGEGTMVTLIHRVEVSVAATLLNTNALLLQTVNSIRF